MKESPKSKAGFTLIEILVYLAVFVIIIGSISALILSIYRTRTVITDRVNTTEDLRLLVKSIRDDMYLGTAISVPDVNTLRITDKSGNTITYALAGDSVTRKVGSAAAIQVTADGTDVRIFTIQDVSSPGSAGTVRITLRLANFPRGTLKPEIVETVTTTISLKFT